MHLLHNLLGKLDSVVVRYPDIPKKKRGSCIYICVYICIPWFSIGNGFLWGVHPLLPVPPQVEERSRLNRQSSPAMPHKVANRISDPNLPPRSESFSISGVQPARTPPLLRPVDPQVTVLPPAGSPTAARTPGVAGKVPRKRAD